jgi:hypothetical protein
MGLSAPLPSRSKSSVDEQPGYYTTYDIRPQGEAPGIALRLVARLVVRLSRDGVHPFRQAHGGGVGEAACCVDLGGDHLAVDDERGAEGLDARAGLGIGQDDGDDRPRGGDDRAVGRDGVAAEGRLAVAISKQLSGSGPTLS